MKLIDDMKIGKKLIAGFLILVIIAVMISAIGFFAMGKMSSNADTMYDENLQKLDALTSADASFLNMRVNTYKLVWATDEAAEKLPESAAELQNIQDKIQDYKSLTLSEDEKVQLAIFDENFPQYAAAYQTVAESLKAGDTKGAIAGIKADGFKVPRDAAEDALKTLQQYNRDEAKSLKEQIKSDYESTSLLFAIITIVAIFLGIGLGLYLTRSITGPIDTVARNLKELGNGHFGNRLRLARKDEIGEMAAAMDQFSDDLQNQVVGTMKKIAVGDLTTNVPVKDSKDEIGPALVQMTAAINLMVHDVNALAKAIDEGKVNTRADATKHQGDYRKIVEGVNNVAINFYNPMKEAIRVAGEYAKQDFTARFDDKVKAEGDMVKFKDALNNVGESVSKAIRAVNIQTADLSAAAEEAAASLNEIATGANQIASGTQKVNDNAEKSSQGIAQVLKAMEDMSAAVEEVTSSMENVSSQSKQTNEASRNGATLVANVEQSMTDISASTETVVSIVGEIERQMADITKIVELIRDLANQTNLLALNAAIEAARAGDAGRGFAVVASEVKSLAEESRVSAEKIEQMITELNTATRNAAAATGGSREQVTRGAQMTREALEAFNTIKESAEKVASAASEVAAAAEEQAATTEEITASIHEVRAQVEGTSKEASNSAAATEEATASINEINKVVDNLNRIVENVSREMAKFTV